MFVTTKAIVATGTYGPKGFAPDWHVPQGAEEADGSMVRVVRDQIGKGADWIKVYADYRWGPNGEARRRSRRRSCRRSSRSRAQGRPVVAHATTAEGCGGRCLPASRPSSTATRHARGLPADGGAGVALCPTLAAGDATPIRRLEKGKEPEPAGIGRSAPASRRRCGGGDHLERQRCRRLHARRQRARAGADGRLRDEPRRRS